MKASIHIKAYLTPFEFQRVERLRLQEVRCSMARWVVVAIMERVERLERREVEALQARYQEAPHERKSDL